MKKVLLLFAILLILISAFGYTLIRDDINALAINRSRAPILENFHREVYADLSEQIKAGIECLDSEGIYFDNLINNIERAILFESANNQEMSRLVRALFRMRLSLRSNFVSKPEAVECYELVKATDRAIRYFEDYIIEYYYRDKAKEDFVFFEGLWEPYLLVNSAYEESFHGWHSFSAGDILLSRNSSFVSAYSAQLGVIESQFSHLSFLYRPIDSPDRLVTLETGGEKGSAINNLEHQLGPYYVRAVAYRPHEETKPFLAAKSIYERFYAMMRQGYSVPFDFTLKGNPEQTLYCSAVVYEGFRNAGIKSFPDRKTFIKPGMLDFANSTGVAVTKEDIGTYGIFAPSDVEFDSHLEVIAEFRNPAMLRDSRQKDIVVNTMFQWITRRAYQVVTPTRIVLRGHLYYFLRRVPLVSKLIENYVPLNLNARQIMAFLTLDFLGNLIQDALNNEELRLGRAMTLGEMESFLEVYRFEDLQKKEDSDFHRWFRP